MSGVVWLVSYPKSGNTWLRALLTHYFSGAEAPVSINDLWGAPLAADREVLEEAAGVDSSELTPSEIEALRPLVIEEIAGADHGLRLIKVHERFRCAPDGRPLFVAGRNQRTIYIVRNPLDVAVSFAHHLNQGLDDVIALMGREDYGLRMATDTAGPFLPEPLGSWSGHVRSWLDLSGVSPLVLRYEDLLRSPFEETSRVLRALLVDVDEAVLHRAIDHSRFSRLQSEERAGGFKERQPTAESFFRAGQAGGWRGVLGPGQAKKLIDDHGAMMRRLGYSTTL